jgi:hypothetical protein
MWKESGEGGNKKKHRRKTNKRKAGMIGKDKMVKIVGFNTTMNERRVENEENAKETTHA